MTALLLLLAIGPHTAPTTAFKTAAPKAMSACLAVSRADVQFALGRVAHRVQEEVRGADSTCDYAVDRGQVTITLQRLKQDVDLPTEIAALQHEIEGSSVRLAPKWGERAFFLDIHGAGTQLHVIRGRNYLLVSILGLGDADSISSAAEKIARFALARL